MGMFGYMGDGDTSKKAAARFAYHLKVYGWPDYGVRCRHGVQGGLHCHWCGEVSKLPRDKKLSGTPLTIPFRPARLAA